MKYHYFVYILSNKNRTVLYIGVTNDLERRVNEHKAKQSKGFTAKYNVHHLIYYERFDSIEEAINREKQLKRWRREWKLSLIKKVNPNLSELSSSYI